MQSPSYYVVFIPEREIGEYKEYGVVDCKVHRFPAKDKAEAEKRIGVLVDHWRKNTRNDIFIPLDECKAAFDPKGYAGCPSGYKKTSEMSNADWSGMLCWAPKSRLDEELEERAEKSWSKVKRETWRFNLGLYVRNDVRDTTFDSTKPRFATLWSYDWVDETTGKRRLVLDTDSQEVVEEAADWDQAKYHWNEAISLWGEPHRNACNTLLGHCVCKSKLLSNF